MSTPDQPTEIGADQDPADQDPLEATRTELAEVEGLPVADRVVVFERANDTIASELAALDEV